MVVACYVIKKKEATEELGLLVERAEIGLGSQRLRVADDLRDGMPMGCPLHLMWSGTGWESQSRCNE